jgi:hypothetical protein
MTLIPGIRSKWPNPGRRNNQHTSTSPVYQTAVTGAIAKHFDSSLTASQLHKKGELGMILGFKSGEEPFLPQKTTTMKKLIVTSILALLFAGGSAVMAQDWPEEYLGLPGDNLNLYAVMDLFQESETLEAFERKLNDPERMINNLDLTGDNYVDYIMVHHYVDGDIHSIVLRVALNEYEYQDVAVFTVQQFSDGTAQVQLIGDEALYGPNYIIEPIYAETPNPGYRGNVTTQVQTQPRHTTVVRTTYYEVAHWPVIVYISRPGYRPWRSAWYWGYHPTWWSPWTPHYWHFYYGYHYNWRAHYYAYYRPWNYYRCGWYHNYYLVSVRRHSPTVVVMVNRGTYKHTYSRPETRRQGEVHFAQRNPRGGSVGNRSITPAESHRARSGRDGMEAVTREERVANQPRVNNESRSSNAARQQTNTSRQSTANENARSGQSRQVQESATPARGTANQPARNVSAPASSRSNNSGQPARTNTAPAPRQNSAPARTAPASNSRNERQQAPAVNRQERSSGSSAAPASRSNQRSSGSSAAPASRSNQRNSGSSAAPASRSNQRNSGSSAVQNSRSNQRNSGSSAAPASRSNQRSTSRGSGR